LISTFLTTQYALRVGTNEGGEGGTEIQVMESVIFVESWRDQTA